MVDDSLTTELERLKTENERLKRDRGRAVSLKVSEKGGVSVYGLGRFPVTLYIALLVTGLLALPASAQQAPSRIDVASLGPQIGDQIADFRLEDQQGAVRTRDSIMGPNGAMLVFSRSVDW